MAIAYVVYRNGETPNYSVGIREKWRNSEKTKRELLDDVMVARSLQEKKNVFARKNKQTKKQCEKLKTKKKYICWVTHASVFDRNIRIKSDSGEK